jgi:hypothetical protein
LSPRPQRELGWRVVEVNASDARNKSDAKTGVGIAGKTSNRVREMVTSTRCLAWGGGLGVGWGAQLCAC